MDSVSGQSQRPFGRFGNGSSEIIQRSYELSLGQVASDIHRTDQMSSLFGRMDSALNGLMGSFGVFSSHAAEVLYVLINNTSCSCLMLFVGIGSTTHVLI